MNDGGVGPGMGAFTVFFILAIARIGARRTGRGSR